MKKRILFVDDEPNILQGLQRMLRGQRKEWDMAFAESGVQALEMMEQEPFDAIISDMRMPGMDGAELLDEIRQHWPNSVRFVLSGHSDQELVMRSVGPSHQYLSKPCDPEVLKATLANAFSLRELLASESLRTLVGGMSSLPSLPTVYHAVVEAMQSEDASIHSIGDLISQDPGMTAKVLQLVNSAYFGLRRQVASPAEAASFLGLDVLKNLILSEGVFSQFDEAVVKAMSLDTIRNRSLLIATVARQIAKAEGTDQKVTDQALLGGLLHDMGTLLLAANMPDDFLRARNLMRQEQIDVWEAEQRVFGATHAEVGAYMLGLWGIDDDVVAAVAYHYKPGNYPSTQFTPVTAVYIAYTGLSEGSSKELLPLSESLDLDYLETIGLSDRVPDWQELCRLPEEDAA